MILCEDLPHQGLSNIAKGRLFGKNTLFTVLLFQGCFFANLRCHQQGQWMFSGLQAVVRQKSKQKWRNDNVAGGIDQIQSSMWLCKNIKQENGLVLAEKAHSFSSCPSGTTEWGPRCCKKPQLKARLHFHMNACAQSHKDKQMRRRKSHSGPVTTANSYPSSERILAACARVNFLTWPRRCYLWRNFSISLALRSCSKEEGPEAFNIPPIWGEKGAVCVVKVNSDATKKDGDRLEMNRTEDVWRFCATIELRLEGVDSSGSCLEI